MPEYVTKVQDTDMGSSKRSDRERVPHVQMRSSHLNKRGVPNGIKTATTGGVGTKNKKRHGFILEQAFREVRLIQRYVHIGATKM